MIVLPFLVCWWMLKLGGVVLWLGALAVAALIMVVCGQPKSVRTLAPYARLAVR